MCFLGIIEKYYNYETDKRYTYKVIDILRGRFYYNCNLNDIKNILYYGIKYMTLYKKLCGEHPGFATQRVNDLLRNNFNRELALGFYDHLDIDNKKLFALSLDYWRDYDYIDLAIRQSIDTIAELDIPPEIVHLIYNNLNQMKN
jgi:hypothetical protein